LPFGRDWRLQIGQLQSLQHPPRVWVPSTDPVPLGLIKHADGVAYYRDVFGLKVNYAQHDIGVMDRTAVTILLIARPTHQQGIGSCYVYVRNADALYAKLLAKRRGVPISEMRGPKRASRSFEDATAGR
jgi:hypothetical protein